MLEPEYLLLLGRQLTSQPVVGALLLLKHHMILRQAVMQRPTAHRSTIIPLVIYLV